MADNQKIMHFANFNITYGPNEEPMLEHFEDIIFPAFTSGFRRGKSDEQDEQPVFYFDGVDIKKIDDEYVMVGNYIKDTQYKVHTTVQDGKLVSTPVSVPTAPYSRFIIFLRNHRMVLVPNEPQSPNVRSFQATVRALLNDYVRKANRKVKKNGEKLPHALVNIVDIPLSEDIEDVLRAVNKINSIKFRFFPLNNDINPTAFAEDIKKQMKKLGSQHANAEFKSPDSKSEVISLMQGSAGLATITLNVRDEDGNNAKIREDKFTSSKKIQFGKDIQTQDDYYIVNQAQKDSAITTVSEDNQTLYNRFKTVIEKLIG